MTTASSPGVIQPPLVPYPQQPPDVLLICGAEPAIAHLKDMAALMVNCTKLPNPFNRVDLKDLDGLHPQVRDFLLHQKQFLDSVTGVAKMAIQHADQRFNKDLPVLVPVFCFGGHHRSPAFAYECAQMIKHTRGSLDIEVRRVPYLGRGTFARPTYKPLDLSKLHQQTVLVARWPRVVVQPGGAA